MTLKQLEALYWTAKLGGFNHAARKLFTTQSTISQRILELEAIVGVTLFDRATRTARLTEKGLALLGIAEQILDLRDIAIEQISHPSAIEKIYRIGLTELTAMTWLPAWIECLKSSHPRLIIEPYIDQSSTLKDRLIQEEIDLLIAPDAYTDLALTKISIEKVDYKWMCKPGTQGVPRPTSIEELSRAKILSNISGPGLIYNRWFQEIGFTPNIFLASNSIVALVALVVSGTGVSYLPHKSLTPLLERGLLEVLEIDPALPPIDYVAYFKTCKNCRVTESIIALAKQCCDFDQVLNI